MQVGELIDACHAALDRRETLGFNVMRFIEQPIPAIGEVKIRRELVPGNFQGCKIVQHGGTFRLHEDHGTSTSSFTVSESDALWIIDAMGLGPSLSIALRRVVIWQ